MHQPRRLITAVRLSRRPHAPQYSSFDSFERRRQSRRPLHELSIPLSSHRKQRNRHSVCGSQDMESLLGFKEPLQYAVVEEKSQSLKLVPWISWDEWKFVKESIFSSSPDLVPSALQRISTWRSRGCIPVAIDITASIVEIHQKDPFFRSELDQSSSQSEEMLAMLYCMAIMRLVNGVVEKTRKKNEMSIGEAADAIGLPRMLIDIRHEGSHRDLPSLQLVRLASRQVLDWLISYYWEPQDKAIPVQEDQSANTRKDIKRKLCEVALYLKSRKIAKTDSSQVKGKRSKKHVSKSLKKVLRLYSSFSPEVVDVLLDYLVNALDSAYNLEDLPEDSPIAHIIEDKQTAYDDWKSVVLKLSRKNPEFLLTLTQAVLQKMETQEAINHETDVQHFDQRSTKSYLIEVLSSLFEWLVGNLKTLYSVSQNESPDSKCSTSAKIIPESTLMGLLRRCLLLSTPSTKQLMASVLILAQLTEDSSLIQKLKKLSAIVTSNLEPNNVNSCEDTLLSQQEHSIQRAKWKFELIRCRRKPSKNEESTHTEIGIKRSSKWSVTKSWNPCPIGMLPHTIGFSGRLSVLECARMSDEQNKPKQCGKREAIDIDETDSIPCKKLKDKEANFNYCETDEDVKGHLLVDGEWKKVGEDELFAIASSVRLLV